MNTSETSDFSGNSIAVPVHPVKTCAGMQNYLLTTALDRGGYSASCPSPLGPGYPPNMRLGMIQSQPESLASSGNRTTIPQTANTYSTHYTG